jgi:hypothetical protein
LSPAWGKTVGFNVLFLGSFFSYLHMLIIRSSPKEINRYQAL